ncbi:Phosphatidylinositol 4,5-bisphosphate-binding protein SLM2 [Sphaceloma murrayae]|uniref:Phosphatidylinositol 4,5-bisphosphate-binding protein SLM2 n=1 Tax=Sphaceloma murrayae TaxID=2082308 RepID=A0A2K1R3P6_9PEZI|nr:Phosphatidylinositol 4,5-bisphosphate-binding protein SLM2 [Sphaceloma murrayae]
MAAAEQNLPTRTLTTSTDDDAVPGEDTSEVTKLFLERLQAWKHACGYLEDYIEATEKLQHHHGKEYERVLKTVSNPLKEGHHFDQQLGGVAGLFDNMRSNTQGLANSHTETAKVLKGTVLPILERLHAEIKNKNKELTKGAGKGSKLVDKARNTTQKHIELLGQHTASFDSSGGKVHAHEDPYILQRGVYHRLNKQIVEENNNRQDLLSVQNSFAQFEAHIVQTFQDAINQFNQTVGHQADQQRAMYGDITANSSAIKPDFEWNGFIQRNNSVMIDPSGAPRSIDGVNFPNQNHRATQPMIAGSLEKKGKVLKKYETNFYVVTPSKYLHEFKTDDDFAKDPTPENSLYLPDCVVGALDGLKFAVKGKDASKGTLGIKIAMSHEFQFKAHTPADAQKWHEILQQVAGQTSTELPDSSPSSPASRTGSGSFPPHTAGESQAAPVSAVPTTGTTALNEPGVATTTAGADTTLASQAPPKV